VAAATSGCRGSLQAAASTALGGTGPYPINDVGRKLQPVFSPAASVRLPSLRAAPKPPLQALAFSLRANNPGRPVSMPCAASPSR